MHLLFALLIQLPPIIDDAAPLRMPYADEAEGTITECRAIALKTGAVLVVGVQCCVLVPDDVMFKSKAGDEAVEVYVPEMGRFRVIHFPRKVTWPEISALLKRVH